MQNLSAANGQFMSHPAGLSRLRPGARPHPRRLAPRRADPRRHEVRQRRRPRRADRRADDARRRLGARRRRRFGVGCRLDPAGLSDVVDRHAAAAFPPADPNDAAQYPLETIQPAIRAFWDAYVSSRRLGRARGRRGARARRQLRRRADAADRLRVDGLGSRDDAARGLAGAGVHQHPQGAARRGHRSARISGRCLMPDADRIHDDAPPSCCAPWSSARRWSTSWPDARTRSLRSAPDSRRSWSA